ncbi:MAG: substrate-binding domain-containing protein [Desulfuromonadaceae bacterium]|nr:substrate-binding domain-containing protein [Desulfuromonadaceae bacterium]MDD5107434.1 substrate-binding domain-containing protein [Desulfuromonadaceae bacterium]
MTTKQIQMRIMTRAVLILALVWGTVVWAAPKTIILATTTSTQDSGLLDVLVPQFEKESGYVVKTISVGSGQAMKMGEKGEADVLLVHSPEAEKKFMAEGYGITRRLVMHNDFIIVGPAADPAKIKGVTVASAMKQIAQSGAIFISRGDNSGTHAKEKGLWKAAGITPDGQKWYQQTGAGMGQSLNVAAEKKSYILTDRATYLALKKNLGLSILNEGDSKLLNIYHVIELNPVKSPKIHSAGGKAFADFMISRKAQDSIKGFGVEKYGAPLFFPDAGKNPASLGL